MQNRCTTAEARLAAMCEQCASAKEEAAEWRYKHDAIAADTKEAVERANVKRDRTIKEGQMREDALRAQIAATVAQKVLDRLFLHLLNPFVIKQNSLPSKTLLFIPLLCLIALTKFRKSLLFFSIICFLNSCHLDTWVIFHGILTGW